MASYSTPGVYVEEISSFPPTIAPVATAIPAFIGYTEKATFKKDDDLLSKPFRISSLLEYEQYFGYADDYKTLFVEQDSNGRIEITENGAGGQKTVVTSFAPEYKMYYSLQMYFANGGGPCYIVSIGNYQASANVQTDITKGITSLEKQAEPTLIVLPDAHRCGDVTKFYSVYKDALTQCAKLQNRFTIIDTYTDESLIVPSNPVEELRNKIGTDYLNYGAAYYPFLDTILTVKYSERNVLMEEDPATTTSANKVQAVMDQVSVTTLAGHTTALKALEVQISAGTDPDADVPLQEVKAVRKVVDDIINELKSISTIEEEGVVIGQQIVGIDSSYTGVQTATTALKVWINDKLVDKVNKLGMITFPDVISQQDMLDRLSGSAPTSVYSILEYDGSTDFAIVDEIDDKTELGDLKTSVTGISIVVTDLSELKKSNNLLYNQIKNQISGIPVTLPPSSTIAGVYAKVDNNNGVWKAPANVSLNYVISPTVLISNEEQGGMNVSSDTGKSVNAIRPFTGKGILVWGARTLDGNSREWKYISVRRFYIFAEQSIKNATEPFVFQSNDGNTWVKVRAMIESFLTDQWKAGALAGASTEQAFYVRVGLGQTMTPEDVLDGKMIVEVGMAVVRPAEFIILRFTHKMQEA